MSQSSLRLFDVYDNNLLLRPEWEMEMISEVKLFCLKAVTAVGCIVNTAAHSLPLLY